MRRRSAAQSLRAQLLVELGFFTSAAVIIVGVTTAVLSNADLAMTAVPLIVLWGASTIVFAIFGAHLLKRSVMTPLRRLAAEADTLAGGNAPPSSAYGSRELDHLAERYRAMAVAMLDMQAHTVRVEKLAGIGQLAAGVAHEVRNPLGALATYVEVLRRRGAAPDVVADMERAIGRVDRTVQSLLDYAKPGVAIGTCDLDQAVRVALDFLTAQGVLRERELQLALAPNLPPVRGETHALEQVVVNLVVNAVQASPAGSRLTLGTVERAYERGAPDVARAGDTRDDRASAALRQASAPRPWRTDLAIGAPGVLLYVADEGPGVPVELRERVFDPFFTTKAPGEGTGLGLAIVARTVHDAGGTVWVDPGRNGGAVFKVFLPLTVTTHARADR